MVSDQEIADAREKAIEARSRREEERGKVADVLKGRGFSDDVVVEFVSRTGEPKELGLPQVKDHNGSGQSYCLFFHDDPLLKDFVPAWHHAQNLIERYEELLEFAKKDQARQEFAERSTVKNIMESVECLRNKLLDPDDDEREDAAFHATNGEVAHLWRMMNQIGGNPLPAMRIWAGEHESGRWAAWLRATNKSERPPVPPIAEIVNALGDVEQWCENAKSDCPVTLKNDGRTVVIDKKDYPIEAAEFATLRVLVELHPRRPGKEELENRCEKRGVMQPVKAFNRTYKRGEPFSRILYKPRGNRDGYGFNVAMSAT